MESFRRDLGPFVVAAQTTRMPMVFTDAKEAGNPIVFANEAFLRLTGYDGDEVLAKRVATLMADGAEDARVAIEAAFAFESGDQPEVECRRKDGSRFWTSVFVSPVTDANGAIIQNFASFVDLTRHREEGARCKMLIDELNHRVKNTLSTVQSIVTQALRRPAEPAEIGEAIESRLMALSGSHDLLTGANWKGAGLHDLVHTALHPFEVVSGRSERFTIKGDNIHLSPKTTLSLAIALHELATNAVKYGAFSNEAGTIAIEWSITPSNRLILRWVEKDGPPVTAPTRKGFGSWVIERGLAHELGGRVTQEYLREGLECTIDIPAPAAISE